MRKCDPLLRHSPLWLRSRALESMRTSCTILMTCTDDSNHTLAKVVQYLYRFHDFIERLMETDEGTEWYRVLAFVQVTNTASGEERKLATVDPFEQVQTLALTGVRSEQVRKRITRCRQRLT